MARRNPIDEALSKIDGKFKEANRRVSTSPIPPLGTERLSKREAATRMKQDWKRMTPEKRQALIQAQGPDAILDLIGAG